MWVDSNFRLKFWYKLDFPIEKLLWLENMSQVDQIVNEGRWKIRLYILLATCKDYNERLNTPHKETVERMQIPWKHQTGMLSPGELSFPALQHLFFDW